MDNISQPGKSILLVEDNPDDEALTLLALRNAHIGNKVVVARDGVQAVEYLLGEGRGELPGMVLLDFKLPKWDGLEVLRRLRANERTRLLPVVMLTSSTVEQDVQESYRHGASSYVFKPVDFDEFVAVLRPACAYWLARAGAVASRR